MTPSRPLKPSRAVASFDSATGMLRALSRYLAGTDVPSIGQVGRTGEPAVATLLGGVNHLPARVAERVYAASGVAEAIPRSRIGDVDAEEIASWIVDHYPRRRYPVIFVGSSNGALVHLACALDAPWLPQTVLLPLRRGGVDRDDAEAELASGVRPGRALLERNPSWCLHHMHDPNQDRLMIAGMSYFRAKYRRLPAAYERFISEFLEPGGTVVTVECGLSWPTTRVSDRHLFQFGALGGADQEEYFSGGSRVSDLLRDYGASRRAWTPPTADQESPEAEWGFDPGLLDDLDELCQRRGFARRRLRFDHPENLSPVVADVYRWWYGQRGIPTERLLAERFLLMEPWWTLRTGSVPFWMSFNTTGSRLALERYLDDTGPYDEVRLLLFSHGTESIGLATAQDWRRTVHRARAIGRLVGVDTRAYPRDFASLARAHQELSQVRHRYPMPASVDLSTLDSILSGRNEVTWARPS